MLSRTFQVETYLEIFVYFYWKEANISAQRYRTHGDCSASCCLVNMYFVQLKSFSFPDSVIDLGL